MGPEGTALLAACPAKQLDETFPENFSRQGGLCWGRDCGVGNVSDRQPQQPCESKSEEVRK